MRRISYIWICMTMMYFVSASMAYVKDDVWQVHKAVTAPVIDGDMDVVYWAASTERCIKLDGESMEVDGYLDLFVESRVLWDDTNLYIFIKVVDDELSSSSANSYENDSAEIYFDAGNDKDTTYGADDVQTRIELQDGSDATLYDSCPEGTEAATDEWEAIDGDAFGWILEVAFPLEPLSIAAEEGEVFGFEIQINDRDNESREHMYRWWGTDNMAWQDPSLFGTAELIGYEADEVLNMLPLESLLDIDGVMDAAWKDIPAIHAGTYVYTNNDVVDGSFTEIEFWEDLQMTFKTCWDFKHFYLWMEVLDEELCTSGVHAHENDGIELFFDGGNEKTEGAYDDNDVQMRWVTNEGHDTGAPNSVYAWGELESGLEGYTFECVIPVEDLPFEPDMGKKIGFEVQVNDRDNEARENMIRWWGSDNMTGTDASRMGTAIFPDFCGVQFVRIDILSPKVKDTCQSGKSHEIQWISHGIGRVDIAVSYDNGNSWEIIAPNIESSGSYDWQIPSISTTQAYIQIEASGHSWMYDKIGPFTIQTDISDIEDVSRLPDTFSLHPNHPNPFNSSTRILYTLPEPARVTLNIYNLEGRHICTMIQDRQEAGSHHASWNGTDESGNAVSSGVYLCRMQAIGADQTFSSSRKMMLVK
ncbi:T9SS type A sorting domain-containing protein [bacterium]|nr:T9SS type A sorting domain-containing protein [bacterium]